MSDLPGAIEIEQALRDSSGLYRAGLNALPAHIAVVDSAGVIVLVNRAWIEFARANGGDPEKDVAVGANYLDVCRCSIEFDVYSREAFDGVKAVLDGRQVRFSMEYPCPSNGRDCWYAMDVAALETDRRIGAIISHLDITARKEAQMALSASETRFRAMFDLAAVGIAEIAADSRFQRVNPALLRILGRTTSAELIGKTARDVTHVEDRDADGAHFEVLRSGGAETSVIEKRLLRGDGTYVWTAISMSCQRATDGSVDYFLAVVEDISERRHAQDRQKTMMRELAHRGKNLLAVVQSIAYRSMAGDRSLSETRDAFLGRLRALSATYGALSDEGFDGAHLETVLNNALAPFGERARLDGPDVILTVKAAQTFGLIAHELATNAAKYGALSVPDGALHVHWDIVGPEKARELMFNWRESGGPPCGRPQRSGFGTTILTRIAGAEFDCQPRLDYAEDGLRYCVEAALARVGSEITPSPVRRQLRSGAVAAFYDQWTRLRGPHGELPPLAGFDWGRFAATGSLTIATVDADDTVRFVEVGRALLEELGIPPGEYQAGETEGPVETYRRCAVKAEPCHELLRFDFGDGDPLVFERLLAPFSATGGRIATHVVGIAFFEGATRTPG
jgi:PAS domain S-box-containing protein